MLHRLLITLSISALLILGCHSAPSVESAQSNLPSTGTSSYPLPQMLLTDASGRQVHLDQFRGKMVFVNLWASWCGPCRSEMPTIQELYKKTDSDSVQFVMIALDDRFETSLAYLQKAGLDLPVFHPVSGLPDLFNVEGIPATFIFNSRGELIRRVDGSMNYDSPEFERLLKP